LNYFLLKINKFLSYLVSYLPTNFLLFSLKRFTRVIFFPCHFWLKSYESIFLQQVILRLSFENCSIGLWFIWTKLVHFGHIICGKRYLTWTICIIVTHENHKIINAHISLVITSSQIEIMRPWLLKSMMLTTTK